MEPHKLEKDLVFFNPGESGAIFTYKAGNLISDEILEDTIDHLEFDTEDEVGWIEERRAEPRLS